MKSYKIIALFALLFIGFQTVAQSTSKVKDITFHVEGNCGMCEKRIENALDIKGVKLADWDMKTKECRVVFRTDKISEEQIHQVIADAGHTTAKVKVKPEVYDNLHGCCKY